MPDKIKSTITSAFSVAIEIMMKHYGGSQEYEEKENHASIVTKTDLACEAAIRRVLRAATPKYGIIGEETGYEPGSAKYTWVIDPIDGTSNFAAGLPWFGPLIALLDDRAPIAAGAAIPCYNKIYYAAQGQGAFCNGQEMRVSKERKLKNALVGYGMDCSDNQTKIDRQVALFGKLIQRSRNMRLLNCLVDHCFVAEGKLGAVINHNVKIWDYAAPWLLITEAGGMATDIAGRNLNFNTGAPDLLDNHSILAANKVLHKQLLDIAKSV